MSLSTTITLAVTLTICWTRYDIYRYGFLYRFRCGFLYRVRCGFLYRFRYGFLYRFRYGFMHGVLYMFMYGFQFRCFGGLINTRSSITLCL